MFCVSIIPKCIYWVSPGPGTKITKRRWRELKKRTGERVLNPSHMMAVRRKGGGGFLCQNPFLEIVHIAGSQNRPFLRMWMVWSQALNGTGLQKTATLTQRCLQKITMWMLKFNIASLVEYKASRECRADLEYQSLTFKVSHNKKDRSRMKWVKLFSRFFKNIASSSFWRICLICCFPHAHRYFSQVCDSATEGGAPYEPGKRNVISAAGQNIFCPQSWNVHLEFVWFSCPSKSHFWQWLRVAVEYTNKLTNSCWLSVRILATGAFVSQKTT